MPTRSFASVSKIGFPAKPSKSPIYVFKSVSPKKVAFVAEEPLHLSAIRPKLTGIKVVELLRAGDWRCEAKVADRGLGEWDPEEAVDAGGRVSDDGALGEGEDGRGGSFDEFERRGGCEGESEGGDAEDGGYRFEHLGGPGKLNNRNTREKRKSRPRAGPPGRRWLGTRSVCSHGDFGVNIGGSGMKASEGCRTRAGDVDVFSRAGVDIVTDCRIGGERIRWRGRGQVKPRESGVQPP